MFKLSESLIANRPDKTMKMFRPLEKPAECFLTNFEVLRVASLDTGFVENVVPCCEAVLFARPCLDEPTIVILG